MINDRGNLKFSGFFMPEHKKMLNELYQEQYRVERPELDEQKLEEFNEVLGIAIEEQRELKVVYYKDHSYHQVQGVIQKVDHINQRIQVKSDDVVVTIRLEDIIDMKLC